MSASGKYVLITPTRDEEAVIGETIASVVSQSLRPLEWVIVSDGSTDRTDSIIQEARKENPWIKLIQLPPREGRCFGAVARASKLAVRALTVTDYDYVGLLDSDLRFGPDYFATLISRFEEDKSLGLAGGRVVDPGDEDTPPPDNLKDVPGAVQFFRRSCFESLRDIHAIPEGGWDMLTCAESRLNGYTTRLFPDLIVSHLKPRNIAHGGILQRRWQCGVRDHALGYHPLFETVKCLRRLRERPYVLSSVAWWLGYMTSLVRRKRREIPADLASFIHKEQLERLLALLPRSNKISKAT